MFPLALTALLLTAAPEPIKLAVFPLKVVNLDARLAGVWEARLAQQLRAQGVQVTATKDDLEVLLGHQRQQQLLGCTDDTCAAQFGDLLAVDGLVTGSVTSGPKGYSFDLRIVEPGKGTVLANASADASQDPLGSTIPVLAQQLARQVAVKLNRTLTAEKGSQIVLSGTLVKRLSWVPAVVGVLAAAGGTVSLVLANGSYKSLTTPQMPLLTSAQADQLVVSGKLQQTLGIVGLSVGGAALLAAAGMFLFGGDEVVTASFFIAPGQAGLGFSGVFP